MHSYFKKTVVLLALFFTLMPMAWAQENNDTRPDYPRTVKAEGASMVVHHPVIVSWKDFELVEAWIPVEVTQDGSDKTWIGSVRASAHTHVDLENRLVHFRDTEVLERKFPGDDIPAQVLELTGKAIREEGQTVVLEVVLHALAEDFQVHQQGSAPVQFNNQPPRIEVSQTPMQLMLIDKAPVLAPIQGTGLQFVVNSDWKLFYEPESASWFVLNQGSWQTHSMLATGGWNSTDELPEDFRTMSIGDEWTEVREALPASLPAQEPQPFLVSLEPTELIVIDSQPRLREISGAGGLAYVENTESDLFRFDGHWYFLAASRWFSNQDLEGRWQAVAELPPVFSEIPEDHPRSRVRVAVPGTVESMVAMMEATLPRSKEIIVSEGPGPQVGYVGEPQFMPIVRTEVSRALNTPSAVIQHNNYFYLCEDAAWYFSRDPKGPFQVARSVPEEIYAIPPSDPLHYITYVRPVVDTRSGDSVARFTYNSGYLGEYSTGVTVVYGTGYYYSPWLYNHPTGYPVYWSHRYTYGYRRGGYYGHRFNYYGGYWPSSRTISMTNTPVGVGSQQADPAFQDPRLTRRGYDYKTLQGQRYEDYRKQFSADDDLYTNNNGDVYRRSEQGWSQNTNDGWSTMQQLERQYGTRSQNAVGQLEAPPQQRQAYKQDQEDLERIERYYQSRKKAYNMHSYVYVGR